MSVSSQVSPAFTQPRSARILLVDAEPRMSTLLHDAFAQAGHSLTTCARADRALQLLHANRPERVKLVILDLLLPDMDGFELIRRIRKTQDIPIIVMSSLSSPDDIARALDWGADGYLCKPVTVAEVVAKTQALLRRVYLFDHRRQRQRSAHGDIRLDQDRRLCTVAGRTVRLSVTEYQLVRMLLAREDRPVCKRELLQAIWGQDGDEPSNVVELAIARLRRKIEDDPARPCRLVTVRSVGYQLRRTVPAMTREPQARPFSDRYTLRGPAAGVSRLPHLPAQQPIS